MIGAFSLVKSLTLHYWLSTNLNFVSLLKVVFECGMGSTLATASLNSKVTETRDLYLQQCCCVQKLVGGTKSLKIPLYEGPLVWLHKLCFPHESLWHRCVHKSNDISEIGQRFTAKKTTDTQLSKVCWRAGEVEHLLHRDSGRLPLQTRFDLCQFKINVYLWMLARRLQNRWS